MLSFRLISMFFLATLKYNCLILSGLSSFTDWWSKYEAGCAEHIRKVSHFVCYSIL